MPETVTETEIRELAEEFTQRFPHLSPRKHHKLVSGGYGNYFGKEFFRDWYERTIPLLTPKMVRTSEQIGWILFHDSHLVPERGEKPLYQLLQTQNNQ